MNSKDVFVVHGRNEAKRKSMFAFLRAIGLQPLEWSKIVKATGKPNPYVGEVLEKGFSMAQAVVVLLTPDDEAHLRQELQVESKSSHEDGVSFQPRPNVLIEAGMALGMFPERTIIVEIGLLRQITDLLGRHVIRLDDSPQQRHELAQRLQTAKCDVDITGKDWYTEGSFDLGELTKTSIENKITESHTTQSVVPVVSSVELVTDKNNATIDNISNYKGLTGGIQLLIDKGFFNQVKSVRETQSELKKEGYYYEAPTITQILTVNFSNKRKILQRIRENGILKFVIRK